MHHAFLDGYMTEERLVWEKEKGQSSVQCHFFLKEDKATNRYGENQHDPGLTQKGGEEGQSQERDCNIFLVWMWFYSCLLQCCRKSGWVKDHLPREGNLLSVQFLLYTICLHLIGSIYWGLNANHGQTTLCREHTPGNGTGGGWM